MATYCDEPRPYDKVTRKHLIAHPECPFESIPVMASALTRPEEGQPRLNPVMTLYGTFLYDEDEAVIWFRRMKEWQAAAPARREARRQEADRRQREKVDGEMGRMALRQEILQSDQAGQDKFRAEQTAYFKSAG